MDRLDSWQQLHRQDTGSTVPRIGAITPQNVRLPPRDPDGGENGENRSNRLNARRVIVQELQHTGPHPAKRIRLFKVVLAHLASADLALLCQSPNFTPRAAGDLISVFTDYINFR